MTWELSPMTTPEHPEDPNFSSFTRKLKEEITAYLELRLTYTRLQAYEKVAKAGGHTLVFLFIACTAGAFLLFISIAMALYLGNIYNDSVTGFLMVTSFYLLLSVLVYWQRKPAALFINNAITGALMKDYEEDKARKSAENVEEQKEVSS